MQQVGNKSGELVQTDKFRLTYMQVFNMFEAEILTTDVAQAKKDVVTWLTKQGLSTQGLCHLPLTFFLNSDVKNQLQGQHVKFNPLPDGC